MTSLSGLCRNSPIVRLCCLNAKALKPSKHHKTTIKLLETMKKTILAIATIVTLTIGEGFAQRYKSYEIPAQPTPNSRRDNAYEEYNINNLDRIVGLTRKQENKIKKIENHYDRLMATRRYTSFQEARKLEKQKEKEILSVLTSTQRQRLYAFQNNVKRNPWRG
jgi:hypothetical protein